MLLIIKDNKLTLCLKKKTFAKSLNMRKQYEKNVCENGNDASIRVQTTINHISILRFYVFTTLSTSKKMFSFRARAEKSFARHNDASGVVGT